MAISNWPGVACQKAYAPLDVIGDNEYFGWFDAGGGGDDDRDALGPFLDFVHACYPTKALMVTEFGFDANRDGPVEERGTYAVPGQHDRLPPRRVRDQAVPVGRDVLRAAGLLRVPRLQRRRPAPEPAVQREGRRGPERRPEAVFCDGLADISLDAADRARRQGQTAAAQRRLVLVSASVPPAAETSLRRTALYERHAAAGAKLVPFAGWEMPIQYAGIREEHVGCAAMPECSTCPTWGRWRPGAPTRWQFLQRMLSNDVRRIPEGGAQYSLLCRDDGGVLDDLFTYRLADCHYVTVTNAANHEKDLGWLAQHAEEFNVDVVDRSDEYAMLAVQGPRARALVQSLSDGALPLRMHCCQRNIAGAPMLVCGTGYTGEDGVELLLDPGSAPRVWDAIVAAGAAPVGLGARDTLRLEACFHLYGNDLSEDRGPIEAGLGWCCKEATGFIGSEAVARRPQQRNRREADAVRDRRAGYRETGKRGRGRRRGHQRQLLAVPGARNRDGVRPQRPCRGRHAHRDRRPGHGPTCPDRE